MRSMRLVVGLLVVALFTVVGLPILWYQEIIELPPVAVRSLGRVAGTMSVGGTMTVQLPVAFHRQEHSLSCEVATLKMALGALGEDVSESELISFLPFDTTPKANGVWGNPHRGFVGDIDGTMFGNGYGVYWEPIAELGLRWRRTEVLTGSSAAEVAQHLAAGRPVIVWGYFGRGRPGSWLTVEGTRIQAINGEHTRVVTGFSGPVDAPTSFALIDPITGPAVWSTGKFMENWGSLGYSGVAVYGQPRWVRAVGFGRVWEISRDGTTRHWVRSWADFVASGGYREAIVAVDEQELLEYKRGSDVIL